MIDIGGEQDYSVVLRHALSCGLQELDCTIVQVPSEQNHQHAIVIATATTAGGEVFRAIGEAYREALPESRAHFVLTVAEARAKTRALEAVAGDLHGPHASDAPNSHDAQDSAGAEVSSKPDPTCAVIAAHSDHPATMTMGSGAKQPEGVQVWGHASLGTQSSESAPARDGFRDPAGLEPSAQDVAAITAKPRTRAADTAAQINDDLGPEVLARMLHLTRRKAESEGTPVTEEEAMQRLDAYFQRAFGHTVAGGTRFEGQRVIQRLTADLARVSSVSGQGGRRN